MTEAYKIKIKPESVQFNCHWYCMKVGQVFDASYIDKVTGCYIVIMDSEKYYVSPHHVEVIGTIK